MVTHRDRKWMQVANYAAGIFSTCAKRQYFAIVVGLNGRVVGTGYNGGPSGMRHCTDGGCPRFAEGSPSGSSYDNCISIHAEENALLWSDRTDRESSTLVINGTPCWGCAKKIAGSGVARLIYILDPAYADWPRAQDLLEQAGVRCFAVELDQELVDVAR